MFVLSFFTINAAVDYLMDFFNIFFIEGGMKAQTYVTCVSTVDQHVRAHVLTTRLHTVDILLTFIKPAKIT